MRCPGSFSPGRRIFHLFSHSAGDFVQLVFNEIGIDGWLNATASTFVSNERFTLQGAIAIPGVYPESRPLSGAHKANFVAGKDNGVQLHIDGEKIRLGSAEASEALALASKVKDELEKIKSAFKAHNHASHGALTTTFISPTANIGTAKVVGE